ncbi:peptidase M28 family protein [Sphingomonas changbaiensis NBRC 104936]|uniref:Peptidase M28 family protein n=1 Tax=Sphingomonas changbaiensis NBRC 104936 TaxID=1219043 RepID=A0A0E9MPF4_9SPHN|nr:M28 family metallopeptidase [Sphingomonas changbaiensis]GAO39368.1 peptidase M28 family protein [Sphingomonas changbaiensis NBRC 104936]
MKRSLLVLALLSTAALAQAPQFSTDRLTQDIKTLSSDAFEGRGPATPGEDKSIAYIAQQMQAAGLQPAGDIENGKHSWYQKVPLLRASIKDPNPKLVLTIAGKAMPLTQGEQIAVRAPLTGQKHVTINNAPLVFVGYGVTAPERNWDDFKGVDVKGKILVVLVNDPDFETGTKTPDGADFGGRAMTYYGRWTYKYEEAARRGAAGVLIVHETAPASYGWNTVKNSNTNAMFDIVRKDPKAEHTPVEAWIQRDEAEAIFKASGLDFDAEKKKAQTRAFKPEPLKATFSADYDVDSEVITSHNVAGIVPGSTHPDELVMYTAHWDHLGVGEPDARGDRIYNGAVDNATGIAQLLELGRAFAKGPQPERSVLFLAVTAEEKGLLGSEYYAANPLYPLAKTVGVLNMDGGSIAGATKNFTISGSAKLGLLDDLTKLAAERGRTYSPDPHPEAGHFYRSDHFSMAKRGVPAISFDGGNDLVSGGIKRGEELGAAYVKDRYHQPADEWSPDWDLTGMQNDLGLLYKLGEDLANSREWPNWSADSEFRRERDKTAAERR